LERKAKIKEVKKSLLLSLAKSSFGYSQGPLRQKNIIIYNRDKGGALWVIGGQDISLIMKKLDDGGRRFKFVSNSGRTTKNKPA
jgi:hypothetical protein